MTRLSSTRSPAIRRLLSTVLAVASAVGVGGACDPGQPVATTESAQIGAALRYGKPVPVVPSQANLVWDDSVNIAAPGNAASWVGAGIRGDGRTKTGQPSSVSEYQGKFCGVDAYLGTEGNSSLNADPDAFYTSTVAAACGSPARLYRFYNDGATSPTYSTSPHHTVLNLEFLAVGQSVSQEVWFGVHQTNCQRLSFTSANSPATNALVTRLPDVAAGTGTARQWRVQSQGTHRAMCQEPSKNTFASTGVSHFLPFTFTITEVKPPAPVYP